MLLALIIIMAIGFILIVFWPRHREEKKAAINLSKRIIGASKSASRSSSSGISSFPENTTIGEKYYYPSIDIPEIITDNNNHHSGHIEHGGGGHFGGGGSSESWSDSSSSHSSHDSSSYDSGGSYDSGSSSSDSGSSSSDY